MSGLEIQGLSKRYGDHVVLSDISFSIGEGEFFVFLGPSGGGKSTLLRVICGLEPPDAGTIVLGDRDITRLRPRDRNIGMVFQDYGLYPHMNTFQNIAYGLEARGMPRREIERRVTEAAEKLGLSPLLQQTIVDLSGGEQQRVALARALAKDADLYLFDEPLSNLDPKLRARARGDIVMLHREKQKPSLYVTHDQNEALIMGDRIGIIAGRRLQQVAVADELLDQPANLFVAGFVGTPPMNLLPTTLGREGDAYCVHGDGLTVRLPERWRQTLAVYGKERVIVGFRPSALSPERRPDGATNTFHGQVEDLEVLIGEIVVTLKVGADTRLAAVFQEADEELVVGEPLEVALDAEQVCLFDPDTEQALAARAS